MRENKADFLWQLELPLCLCNFQKDENLRPQLNPGYQTFIYVFLQQFNTTT